jgi:transcriptional regulator with XRE-family HTH domain
LTQAQTPVNIRPAVGTSEETIGQRVRRLRIEQGLSLRDVAGPGISFAHVSRIEAGRRNPSLEAIELLARRLGASPEYLRTGRRARGYVLRERRLADADLELRLDRDVERAEALFRAEIDSSSGFELDDVLTARAHAGLGLLAYRRSALREAVHHLEAATASGFLHPASRPDVYETLGAAYTAYGAPAKAIALFEECLAQLSEAASSAPADGGLAVRFLTYLALAASSLGDADRVNRVLAEATERAEHAEIPQSQAALYWALAISASNEGQSARAMEYALRTIKLLEETDDAVQLARAHVFAAQMHNREDELGQAERHLEAAAEVLGASADAIDLGLLRSEQAKVAAARGDGGAAMALALEAARLLRDDVRYGGNKWHALAAAQAAAGDVDAASASYGNAVRVLEERRQWREAAHVARESARFLRAVRREDEAWEFLDRAAALGGRQTLRPANAG